MSDISDEQTVPISMKRGERKPWKVLPLIAQKAAVTQRNDPPPEDAEKQAEVAKLVAAGREAAKGGYEAMKTWWAGIGGLAQNRVGTVIRDELKAAAQKVDADKAGGAAAPAAADASQGIPFGDDDSVAV